MVGLVMVVRKGEKEGFKVLFESEILTTLDTTLDTTLTF